MLTTYLAGDLSNFGQRESAATRTAATQNATQTGMRINLPGSERGKKEELRHILLGSPGAIRQTIYLLHRLHYSESALWTPLSPVRGQLVITAEQGEMMSLLRRSL